MVVTVSREAESQVEIYGAYEGEILGGSEPRASGTFTVSGDYLIIVPKNNASRPQLEAGSVPTSYIPTYGATAIRPADTLTVPSANLPYSSTAMSIAMEGLMTYADDNTAGTPVFARWYADANNYILLDVDTDGAATGEVNFNQASAGVVDTVASSGSALSPSVNVPFKIASRHGTNFINGAVNGTVLTADTTPTSLPNLSATNLTLGHTFNGYISKFRVWGDDIGDDGLLDVTS